MLRRGLLLVPRRAGGGVGGRRWGTRGASADGRRLGDAGGASSPALGASPTSVSHGHDGRSHTTAEERFRRTPTWRAKCRISGSGRPLRFELWGARGDLSPTDLRPISSCDLSWK